VQLSGSICALATPFTADGALDLEAYARLIDYQLAGGTQALVVAGSTGEAHMLTDAEWERLLAFALEHVRGRVPVLAGTGAAATAASVRQTRRAQALGCDAALVVTPYYVRPTQQGLLRHFSEVAEHGGLPIVMYNVPSRTGCDLLPETAARLAGHANIIGLKEARGDAARIAAVAPLAQPGFAVLSGDDASAHGAMLSGMQGVISVVNNLVPAAMRVLCDAALHGDRAVTEQHAARLAPLIQALECAPNPVAVKAGLAALGICHAGLRLPLIELEPGAARARLVHSLAALAPVASAA
jgi:4-hydroxy-tetrahydrodipicolinate synthase